MKIPKDIALWDLQRAVVAMTQVEEPLTWADFQALADIVSALKNWSENMKVEISSD